MSGRVKAGERIAEELNTDLWERARSRLREEAGPLARFRAMPLIGLRSVGQVWAHVYDATEGA